MLVQAGELTCCTSASLHTTRKVNVNDQELGLIKLSNGRTWSWTLSWRISSRAHGAASKSLAGSASSLYTTRHDPGALLICSLVVEELHLSAFQLSIAIVAAAQLVCRTSGNIASEYSKGYRALCMLRMTLASAHAQALAASMILRCACVC